MSLLTSGAPKLTFSSQDGEIGCGLLLERAEAEFGLHGTVFPRGTLRVAALEPDGVAAVCMGCICHGRITKDHDYSVVR